MVLIELEEKMGSKIKGGIKREKSDNFYFQEIIKGQPFISFFPYLP